ncbi:MAG: CRISPR system precrRNA processing endoribonuclease RAMP protein Cas6 [Anaerosomatales bacterium]|nr:CRISPR system precrRNA processing endoribonuclease RAMP protein Cas6 [Anaerosomatales bacterium]
MDARVPQLVALDIEVEACAPSRFPYGASFWAYAAFLREVAALDPDAASRAHGAPGQDKEALLTISGLLKNGVAPLSTVELEPGERATVRVSAAGERLVIAVAKALDPSRLPGTLNIGPNQVRITEARLAAVGAPNPASLDDLLEAGASASGPLRLRFPSPTTFERKHLWLAIPSPDVVFGRSGQLPTGLLRYWRMLGGDALESFSSSHVGAVPLWLEPCTARLLFDGGKEWSAPAFVGECEYTAHPDEQPALHTLGLLAQFTGIGQRVAFGMGRVERVDPIS